MRELGMTLMFRAMPDQIDLEPHEYRPAKERRLFVICIFGFAAFCLLEIWVAGLFFDWRGYAIAFFAAMMGACIFAAAPSYWLRQRR